MLFITFEFNLGSIFSFIVGCFFGILIFVLLYVYAVLRSLRKEKYVINSKEYDIDPDEIVLLVKNYQDTFKKEKLKGIGPNVESAAKLSAKLTDDIAKTFFPESKYPKFELSIDESIMLAGYVTQRIDEVLNKRGLKMFRKLRISQIIGWSSVKKQIDDTAIVKTEKKYGVSKKVKSVVGLVNIINPAYWVKKAVVDTSTNIVVRKIGVIIIGIVGEETFKVYSKSLFNKELTINVGVDEFFGELRDELDAEAFENVSVEGDHDEEKESKDNK